MKTLAKAVIAGAAVVAPIFAFADEFGKAGPDFFGIIGIFTSAINTLLPFIIGLAVLVIVWGLFNYIAGAGDEEKRAQAKQYIIWGIIGLFIMVSVWGLVNILARTFDLNRAGPAFQEPDAFTPNCPPGRAWDEGEQACL